MLNNDPLSGTAPRPRKSVQIEFLIDKFNFKALNKFYFQESS